jgi:hypothetical protein
MDLTTTEIALIISVFGSIGAAWLNARISISKLQVEVSNIKDQIKEEKATNEKAFERIDRKLDSIDEKIEKILFR